MDDHVCEDLRAGSVSSEHAQERGRRNYRRPRALGSRHMARAIDFA